jgi:hypothetical protein
MSRGRNNVKPRLAELSAERAAVLDLPWTDVDAPLPLGSDLVSVGNGIIA